MYKITKLFAFSAAHVLRGLPENHPCSRLHGHNYEIKVELTGWELNEVGFVKDYRELDIIKKYIDGILDHKHLNEVFPEMNPSAENLSRKLFEIWKVIVPELSAVEVSETPKTNCRYEL